ncbi:MAG: hypothetical protein AAF637_12685, partial [Pseudomonadota bacterium]
MPAPVSENFQALYRDIKAVQDDLGLDGTATLGFRPSVDVGGTQDFREALYIQPGGLEEAPDHRGDFNRVHDELYTSVEQQYGTRAARRAVGDLRDRKGPARSITLKELDKIHERLTKERSFSEIAR